MPHSPKQPAAKPLSGDVALSLLDRLPIGLVILHLEAPDVGSFRIVYVNDHAAVAAGSDVKASLGKTLADAFPGILDTELPRHYLEALSSGQLQDAGEIRYGDESIPEAVFRVHAVPLDRERVCVVYQNVTARAAEGRL